MRIAVRYGEYILVDRDASPGYGWDEWAEVDVAEIEQWAADTIKDCQWRLDLEPSMIAPGSKYHRELTCKLEEAKQELVKLNRAKQRLANGEGPDR